MFLFCDIFSPLYRALFLLKLFVVLEYTLCPFLSLARNLAWRPQLAGVEMNCKSFHFGI